jgi:hypothetical protein
VLRFCSGAKPMVEADALGKTLDQREPGEQKMVRPYPLRLFCPLNDRYGSRRESRTEALACLLVCDVRDRKLVITEIARQRRSQR